MTVALQLYYVTAVLYDSYMSISIYHSILTLLYKTTQYSTISKDENEIF